MARIVGFQKDKLIFNIKIFERIVPAMVIVEPLKIMHVHFLKISSLELSKAPF